MKLVAKTDLETPKARETLPEHKALETFLAGLASGAYVDIPFSEMEAAKTRAYVQRVSKDTGRKFVTRTITKDGVLRIWAA